MVLIKSCIIVIGIRVKEQTAGLVDINCLGLPIAAIINSSFSSEFCICVDLSGWHRWYQNWVSGYVTGKVTHRKLGSCIALSPNLLLRIILTDMDCFQNERFLNQSLWVLIQKAIFILLMQKDWNRLHTLKNENSWVLVSKLLIIVFLFIFCTGLKD